MGKRFNPQSYIAETIWGPHDHRAMLVRNWLNREFRKTGKGRLVMWLYYRCGHFLAAMVKRSTVARKLATQIFERILTTATANIAQRSAEQPPESWPRTPKYFRFEHPPMDWRPQAEESLLPPITLDPSEWGRICYDLTLAQQAMLLNLTAWAFMPLPANAEWTKPFPGCLRLSGSDRFWEMSGCASPEEWEGNKDRVLAKFMLTDDGCWVIPNQAFFRWYPLNEVVPESTRSVQ